MGTNEINSLIDHLNKLDHGPISDSEKPVVLKLLSSCWPDLHGSDDQKTSEDKLCRAEELAWDGSILTFALERHGGTVNGSTRGALHYWEVDILSGRAEIVRRGVRQLSPMDHRMNTSAKAENVANQILSNEQHKNLQWRPNNYVVLNIGEIIPETNAQTTASRRKKFRAKLESVMLTHGWKRQDHGNKMGFIKPSS
jgi:hypothetical protein